MSDQSSCVVRGALSRPVAIVSAVTLLSACSGHLYTVEDAKAVETREGAKYLGIPVYRQLNVIELYQTRAYVDEKTNKILGRAVDGDCVPVLKQVFAVRTDFSKPLYVRYEPGPFDTSRFALTLKDGALASVNADSDSTAGLKNLAAILPFAIPPYGEKSVSGGADAAPAAAGNGAAPPAGDGQANKKLACNAEAKLIGLYEAPGVRSFDELQKAVDADEARAKRTDGNQGGNAGAGAPGMPRAKQ